MNAPWEDYRLYDDWCKGMFGMSTKAELKYFHEKAVKKFNSQL